MTSLVGLLLGFASGSVPFGYLWVRWRVGKDVRQIGSGNIGATNVGRTLGKGAGLLTLVADGGKGALAVAILVPWGPEAAAAAAFGAVLGHCFTPWLGGRGGKGVATLLGSFALLAPLATALAGLVLGVGVALTRTMSAGSLAGTLVLVISCWGLRMPLATLLAASASAAVVFWQHRGNIARLFQGSERQLGRGAS